jgi:LysM repeat protein
MRAVPGGPVAAVSPAPSTMASTCLCSPTPGASGLETSGPRRTPTPVPTVELTPAPFTYTVQPGDHLVNIANLFGVDIQDVMELNNITNANRISVGQELLIPGYGVQPTPKPSKPPKK